MNSKCDLITLQPAATSWAFAANTQPPNQSVQQLLFAYVPFLLWSFWVSI